MRLVFRGKPTQSRAELFEGYSRQFRRAVDAVFAADETPELADRLRANVSRFAAYKSVYVEGEFAKIAANQEYDAATRKAAMRAAEDRFARWTDAEYNTATARCRTAKQFSEFLEPDNRRLFPNLQWLATRSATPRADHAAFAGKIWPKTDPFWNSHAPGTEWNCKCDIAETDEPATDNSDVPNIEPPRGLEGNPAETGEVFTDNVGYVKNAKKLQLGTELTTKYPSLQQLVDMDGKTYRADYYSDNGGLLMTSRARVDEGNKNKQEKEKFDKEHAMCLTLAKANYIVDYRASVEGEFDVFVNGEAVDLKQTKSHNNVGKYAKKAIEKQNGKYAAFCFEAKNDLIIQTVKNEWRNHGRKCLYYFLGEGKVYKNWE